MRENRSSGSVEGVVGDHDSYSDFPVRLPHRAGTVTRAVPPVRALSPAPRARRRRGWRDCGDDCNCALREAAAAQRAELLAAAPVTVGSPSLAFPPRQGRAARAGCRGERTRWWHSARHGPGAMGKADGKGDPDHDLRCL